MNSEMMEELKKAVVVKAGWAGDELVVEEEEELWIFPRLTFLDLD